MVKSQYGVRTGLVNNLSVVPVGLLTMMEKQDVGNLGGEVLLRRSNLNCQDFDGFKDDTTAVDFLETGEDDDGSILVECRRSPSSPQVPVSLRQLKRTAVKPPERRAVGRRYAPSHPKKSFKPQLSLKNCGK